MSSNMQQAMAKASQFAKSPSQVQARDQAVATANAATPATPAPTLDMTTLMAQMQALMDTNAQLQAQLAAKTAPKAEKKPAVSTKNCTYTHDEKSGKLTIVIDLNSDILDDSGQPKVSSTGSTTGVAQLSGSFLDKSGRKVGISLNAYHKIGK